MKNIKIILFAFLAIFLLNACEKESIDKNSSKIIKEKESLNVEKVMNHQKTTFYCDGDETGDIGNGPCPYAECKGAPTDCLPEVPVSALTVYYGFKDIIEQGSNGVKNFFMGDLWKELFPYMADSDYEEYLTKLRSGNYAILSVKEDSNIEYYIAGIDDGSLSPSNFEFAIPINKTEL